MLTTTLHRDMDFARVKLGRNRELRRKNRHLCHSRDGEHKSEKHEEKLLFHCQYLCLTLIAIQSSISAISN